MFSSWRKKTRFSVETLEPRLPMAGDVAAYLGPDHFGFDTILGDTMDAHAAFHLLTV